MKFLLINPLSGYFKYDPMSMPPLGLLYVAVRLRREGLDVYYLVRNSELYGADTCAEGGVVGQPTDEQIERLNHWTRGVIQSFGPDVIGLTMMTCQWLDVQEMVELSREVGGEDVTILVGGYHPTTVDAPGLLRDFPGLDVAVRGRGEEAMSQLAAGKPWAEIHGLTYRKRSPRARGLRAIRRLFQSTREESVDSAEITHTPSAPFDRSTVLLGKPARDLLNSNYYSKSGNSTIGCYHFTRPSSIVTSIGCPWSCSFCASKIMEPKMAFRPVESVIEEMQEMVDDGVTGMFFYDINFLAWKKRALELIRAIIDSGLNKHVNWLACASAINFPQQLLPELREAGCIGLVFGMESASQKILDTLNKGPASPEQNQIAVDACKRNGIRPQSGFILGVPGEVEEDVQVTFDFIQSNDLLSSLNVLLPLPGTAVNRSLIADGKLDPNHPDYWGLIADTNAPLTADRVYSEIPYERFVELFDYGMSEICAPTWKTVYADPIELEMAVSSAGV